MKRIISISLSLILLIFFFSHSSYAAEEKMSKEISPTPTIIEYQLPYPGLLPDNPLYFFKTIRDRIVSLLIADPFKKSEFNLLQADKRLSTGMYLFEKGKKTLAETTISKGENYFQEALTQAEKATREGKDTKDLIRRLSEAYAKHKEVLTNIVDKSPKDLKENFMVIDKKVAGFEKRVSSLKSKY